MPRIATFLALITLLQWSFLAFLGTRLNHVPPFLLLGIALCISGLTGSFQFRTWRIPLKTFLLCTWGIFGYHFCYFLALRYAPPVEANLINYLWPLLIVMLSPLFLKGFPLKSYHCIGALMGISGATLIATGGSFSLNLEHVSGYLLALGAAVTWSTYSVVTKKVQQFPTSALGGVCLFSGLLSLSIHFGETRSFHDILSLSNNETMYLLLTGIGPMGLAFFTWDAALKRGDPRIIGSLAYLNPMLSTLILAGLGGYPLTGIAILAMLLIVSGAAIGSLDLFMRKKMV